MTLLTSACSPALGAPVDPSKGGSEDAWSAEEVRDYLEASRRAHELTLAWLVKRGASDAALEIPFVSARAGRMFPALPGTVGICASESRSPAAHPSAVDPSDPTGGVMRGDGIEVSRGLPQVVPSVLPPWPFDVARVAACDYAGARLGDLAYMIAWTIVEDERPLRNHYVAFVIEHRATSRVPPRWSVVVMYRHATSSWWNIDYNPFHSRSRPVHSFSARPSGEHVRAVLDENGWHDSGTDDMGFRVLAGQHFDESWRHATGAATVPPSSTLSRSHP